MHGTAVGLCICADDECRVGRQDHAGVARSQVAAVATTESEDPQDGAAGRPRVSRPTQKPGM